MLLCGVPVLDIGDCLGRIVHFADLAKALHHSLGELGILDEFPTVRPFRDAPEAAHPLSDVGLEPNASLFAVIDDIDAGFRLLLQNVQDPQADVGLQCAVVDRLAGLLVDQHLTERLAARDAAGMRRQNSVRARMHLAPPLQAPAVQAQSGLLLGCLMRRSGLYPIPTSLSSGITTKPVRHAACRARAEKMGEEAGFEPSVPREAPGIHVVSVVVRADFSACRKSSRSDMSRRRKLGRVTRNQWFESGFLQRRVRRTPIRTGEVPVGGDQRSPRRPAAVTLDPVRPRSEFLYWSDEGDLMAKGGLEKGQSLPAAGLMVRIHLPKSPQTIGSAG